MATYSENRSISASNVTLFCRVVGTECDLLGIAFRWYGEGLNSASYRAEIDSATNIGGSAGGANKFNSRSPSQTAEYNLGSVLGGDPLLIACGNLDFTHNAWIPGPRYGLKRQINGEYFNFALVSGVTGSENIICAEGTISPDLSKSFRKRTTRPGYFQRFGNELHQHQKTGGGAFSMLAPHFDNDITWVDPSAWKNGMCQSDVWNINLFGITPRRRVNVT